MYLQGTTVSPIQMNLTNTNHPWSAARVFAVETAQEDTAVTKVSGGFLRINKKDVNTVVLTVRGHKSP